MRDYLEINIMQYALRTIFLARSTDTRVDVDIISREVHIATGEFRRGQFVFNVSLLLIYLTANFHEI